MKSASVLSASFQGFRGFLEKVTLPFANGKRRLSICIWGDNGTGKSSFADGVEFFFEPKGVVERLGERTTENKAGTPALKNTRALSRKLSCRVAFEFADGTTIPRGVTGAEPQKLPEEIRELMETVPAPVVLRAAEMRSFVADKKGAERYELFSKWVGLQRLTELQDDLKKTQGKVEGLNRSEAKLERQKDLARVTGGKVVTWDTRSVLDWINQELVHGFGAEFRVSGPSDFKALEKKLADRSRDQGLRLGGAAYESAATALDGLTDESADGIFPKCRKAEEECTLASRALDDARKGHSAAELKDVLETAKDYLTSAKPESCPVCQRAFDGRTTRASVLRQIDETLKKLTEVTKAERKLDEARARLKTATRAVDSTLREVALKLGSLSDSEVAEVSKNLAEAQKQIRTWVEQSDRGGDESFTPVNKKLAAIRKPAIFVADFCRKRVESLSKETQIPYSEISSAVTQLREIGNRWVELEREEAELARVSEQYIEIADRVRGEIRQHVRSIVAELQDDVRAIYADLRQNDEYVPEIDIIVADQAKSMKVEMSLFGLPSLVPSGYLSDSQLNSLGLAVFLAAVRRFNRDFPFVVLDDIMSSYDASHRLNLINVLRKHLAEFQVLVTTHDEAFFKQARGVLTQTGDWQFYRLRPWSLETGVRVSASGAPDEEIDRRIRDGEQVEVVAGLVLDQVENWAQSVCAKSGTMIRVRVRTDGSTSDPSLSDLWQAAQSSFTDAARAHPTYAVVSSHGLLNWPRHAPTSNRMSVTNAEIETFWKNFKKFRQFSESSK